MDIRVGDWIKVGPIQDALCAGVDACTYEGMEGEITAVLDDGFAVYIPDKTKKCGKPPQDYVPRVQATFVRMGLAEIRVDDLGGAPVAKHNMPCPICLREHAVLFLNTGQFFPCWKCQKDGWRTVKLPKWVIWISKQMGWLNE